MTLKAGIPCREKIRATCLHNNAHMRCFPRDIDCSERSIQVTFRPTNPAFLEQNSGLRTFPDISYWTSIRQDFEGRERERGRKRQKQLAASILWINLSQVSDLPPLQWLFTKMYPLFWKIDTLLSYPEGPRAPIRNYSKPPDRKNVR